MWNIVIQPAVGCYNSWANLRRSGCYPLGEKLLWKRSIETGPWSQGVNPIFQCSVKIYLYFVLFCDTEMAWIMKILPHGRQRHIDRTVSKIRKNIYRSKLQDTFELYGHFQMFVGPLFKKKKPFTKYCLTQWISKLPGSFEIHWVRQYLVNCMGLAGIVNATVYKSEPIFTGFGHGKLS